MNVASNQAPTTSDNMPNSTIELIGNLKIIPVVQLDQIEFSDGLADALSSAGLPIAEITLRTECALRAIDRISHQNVVTVGAGTVMNIIQAKRALDAGAMFIVSPGLDEQVVSYCLDANVPVFPGIATATELQRAMNLGLNVVKFFPAEAMGGVKVLKALSAPFGDARFIPTGGINIENIRNYLSIKHVFAVGGSWFVKPELFSDGDFSSVESQTKAIVELIGNS